MIRVCRECGRQFVPRRDYFHTCSECYFEGGRDHRVEKDDIAGELAERLPLLLQLAHPDRHGNSVASTKATQWLLALRKRLPRAA